MALIYNEDSDYLMCFAAKYDCVMNYRVDRMDEVQIEKEPVSVSAIILDDDIAVPYIWIRCPRCTTASRLILR